MNNNNNNQFFDYFKSAMNPELMTNFMKNTPAPDFSSFSDMVKQTAENLANFNQVALENACNVVKKTAEVVQHNTHEFLNFVKESVNANNFEQVNCNAKQCMKSSLQKSMESGKEVMEMNAKSSMQLFDRVNSKMAENVNNNFNKNKKPL